MQNNFISLIEWNQSEVINKDCLYGYSQKSQGYYPFKEIKEINDVGKDKQGNWKRKYIKGLAENGEKLILQLHPEHYQKAVEKGWL